MTLVSVVVPTRDRRELLAATLASILAQTHAALDVVVVDDGSTRIAPDADPLLDDPRVRLLRSAVPAGVAAARNRGLEIARGELIAFCDDDDLWVADKVERQVAALRGSGRAWSYAPALNVLDSLQPWSLSRGPASWEEGAILHRNLVPGGGSAVMATRAALARVGPFDTTLSQFADWDMWIRLAALGAPAPTREVGVLYRLHAAQMSADFSGMLDELRALRRKHRCDRHAPPAGLPPMDGYVVHKMRRAGATVQAIGHVLRVSRPAWHRSALKAIAAVLAYRAGVRRRPLADAALTRLVAEVEAVVRNGIRDEARARTAER